MIYTERREFCDLRNNIEADIDSAQPQSFEKKLNELMRITELNQEKLEDQQIALKEQSSRINQLTDEVIIQKEKLKKTKVHVKEQFIKITDLNTEINALELDQKNLEIAVCALACGVGALGGASVGAAVVGTEATTAILTAARLIGGCTGAAVVGLPVAQIILNKNS